MNHVAQTATQDLSLDARIANTGRVAGVDHSRIYSDWFECRIEVRPAGPGRQVGSAYAWKAVFSRQDADVVDEVLEGSGGSRALAMNEAIDHVTKHIYNVAEKQRLATYGTKAMQPEMTSWGFWRKLVERTRRFFVRLSIRIKSP